jgi:hypothetical protein
MHRSPSEGTGHYIRAVDGRRTRLYATIEAAQRAADRGELYDDAGYAALVAMAAPPKRKKSR